MALQILTAAQGRSCVLIKQECTYILSYESNITDLTHMKNAIDKADEIFFADSFSHLLVSPGGMEFGYFGDPLMPSRPLHSCCCFYCCCGISMQATSQPRDDKIVRATKTSGVECIGVNVNKKTPSLCLISLHFVSFMLWPISLSLASFLSKLPRWQLSMFLKVQPAINIFVSKSGMTWQLR